MDLFVLELIAAAILFYFIGKKLGQNATRNPEDIQYIQLQVSETPEKRLNSLSIKNQEKLDADIQKANNDLNDLKNRENKLVIEIRDLRKILEENSKGQENQRKKNNSTILISNTIQDTTNIQTPGIISDQDFESLLDEAVQGVKQDKEFSEDDFDRELSEAAK